MEQKFNRLFAGRDGIWNEGQTIYDFKIGRVGLFVTYQGDKTSLGTSLVGGQTIELWSEVPESNQVRISIDAQEKVPDLDIMDSDPCFGACMYDPEQPRYPSSIHLAVTSKEYQQIKESVFAFLEIRELRAQVHVITAKGTNGQEYKVVGNFSLHHRAGKRLPNI